MEAGATDAKGNGIAIFRIGEVVLQIKSLIIFTKKKSHLIVKRLGFNTHFAYRSY